MAAARAEGRPARIHLKVDTGMSRAGAVPDDVPALARAARLAQVDGDVEVVALWSHLSRADEPRSGSTEDHLMRLRAAQDRVADPSVTALDWFFSTKPCPKG